jgi:hypothetical protein
MSDPYRLDLARIEKSLREVQRRFPKINALLQSKRDTMSDTVVENMLLGYCRVDHALARNENLLSRRGLDDLLELNHLVLCGQNEKVRREYHRHIDATRDFFYDRKNFNISHVLKWYRKHAKESVWKRAAGVYIRILSQPQLFVEGNHRTGALIVSYLLGLDRKPPFVLSVENAKAYFDPSTLIKSTKKNTTDELVKLPHMKRQFARFLETQAKG